MGDRHHGSLGVEALHVQPKGHCHGQPQESNDLRLRHAPGDDLVRRAKANDKALQAVQPRVHGKEQPIWQVPLAEAPEQAQDEQIATIS